MKPVEVNAHLPSKSNSNSNQMVWWLKMFAQMTDQQIAND